MSNVLALEEPAQGIMLLTLDRPDRRNAIDLELVDALGEALGRFRREETWRAAVLTGRPPAFCAGLDLKVFADPDAPRHRVTELIRSVAELPKPIIAAVNGAAYTGGLELALGCDFILASQEARFADTHAKIGALSGSGMGSRLPHAVGTRFAKQMMLGCQPIDAQTALRLGLVNEVMAPSALLSRAVDLASAIAAHDPDLIRITKETLDQGSLTSLAEAIEIETNALVRRKAENSMTWNS